MFVEKGRIEKLTDPSEYVKSPLWPSAMSNVRSSSNRHKSRGALSPFTTVVTIEHCLCMLVSGDDGIGRDDPDDDDEVSSDRTGVVVVAL